jgi:hypothetical protein
MLVALPSFGCDEACKRAKAEADGKGKFPSYLSQKYCQSVAQDFILRGSKSLHTYRDKQLPTAHRGGAKNIANFINQRKEWLSECDNYLAATDQGRIFYNKKSTDEILSSMNETMIELKKIMLRKETPAENLNLVIAPATQKFDLLFKQVDDHYLELQRRGLM